jgi:arginase
MKHAKVIFSPYFLDKYRGDFHLIKKSGWTDNLYNGKDYSVNAVLTSLNKKIADFVYSAAVGNDLPVALGGDCHKTFGVLKGLKKFGLSPAVLWLDAHGDFNTYKTSPSGFIGGMSLAILTGHEEPALLSGLELDPLPEEKVIIYDARNPDEQELLALKKSKIRQPSGMKELIEECESEESIYIHFDTDVINPEDAPAMLYPAPGGPTVSELNNLFNIIKQKTAAVSVNIWEPGLDKDRKTEKAVFDLLQIFFDGNTR